MASVIGAWINVGFLYIVLLRRDYYRATWPLIGRIARQLIAAGAMGAALYFAQGLLADYYAAGLFRRLFALVALVGAAMIVYFSAAFALGAIDRERVAKLTRKTA
jgi:putative peptidoglycan lipid II flippase